MTSTLACLRCGAPFAEKRRGITHFCEGCRAARKHDSNREYFALTKARQTEVIVNARAEVIPEAREYFDAAVRKLGAEEWRRVLGPGEWVLTAEEYGKHGHGSTEQLATWMPLSGAKRPGGPALGRSTYFGDLAVELDILEAEATRHPWWDENPHWCFDVDSPSALSLNLAPGLTCGDKRGERAGYLRHKRAGEMACPSCAEANTAYFQEYRAA